MKTAFLQKLDSIEIRDITLPAADVAEIRLRVDACGICGTDVTAALDGGSDFRRFGHEVAGTILDIGAGVTNCKPGQNIVLDSASPCGTCTNCRNTRQDLCTNVQSFFTAGHLGFAEEMLSPAVSAVPYDSLSPEHACLAEPVGVAVDMWKTADIRVGSHVVISGLGPIGLAAVRLAKLSGAEKVYACDLSTAAIRLETALKFGADQIIQVDKTPLSEHSFTQPPDRFMVSSPPRTIPPMIGVAATGAVISYIGIKWGEEATLSFDANDFHFKKLQLRGSYASPALCTPFALNLMKVGVIEPQALVSHVFELRDIKEAVRVAATEPDRALKVVVVNV